MKSYRPFYRLIHRCGPVYVFRDQHESMCARSHQQMWGKR